MPEAKRVLNKSSTEESADSSDDDFQSVKMFGPSSSDFVAIVGTITSLMCQMGQAGDGEVVLVPQLHLRLMKPPEDSAETVDDSKLVPAFQGTIAFENGAFLIMDLARDFQLMAERLQLLSTGTVKPHATRMDYSIKWLESAQASLDQSLVHLRTLATAAAPEPEAPPIAARRRLAKSRLKRQG